MPWGGAVIYTYRCIYVTYLSIYMSVYLSVYIFVYCLFHHSSASLRIYTCTVRFAWTYLSTVGCDRFVCSWPNQSPVHNVRQDKKSGPLSFTRAECMHTIP